jgi:hypothetical protein
MSLQLYRAHVKTPLEEAAHGKVFASGHKIRRPNCYGPTTSTGRPGRATAGSLPHVSPSVRRAPAVPFVERREQAGPPHGRRAKLGNNMAGPFSPGRRSKLLSWWYESVAVSRSGTGRPASLLSVGAMRSMRTPRHAPARSRAR